METELKKRRLKVMFVNSSEEDTKFLTRGLPIDVIQASSLESAKCEIEKQPVDGVFVDVGSLPEGEATGIRTSQLASLPVVILAGITELMRAIEQVKKGASGFLVKGVSDSASVIRLMQYAHA